MQNHGKCPQCGGTGTITPEPGRGNREAAVADDDRPEGSGPGGRGPAEMAVAAWLVYWDDGALPRRDWRGS